MQDVWVRWQSTNRSVVQDPPAFLAKTTTRLCISLVQSAHLRRETYVGEWLPEPVDTAADPALGAERGEALGFAVLVLLEKRSPKERAAYVLREAFDYSYRQIVDILHMDEANIRQLSPAPGNISPMTDARPSVKMSSAAFWRFLSMPPRRETWLDWRVSSRRMSSLTRMAVGLCARRGFRFAIASALRSSSLPLHVSGKA